MSQGITLIRLTIAARSSELEQAASARHLPDAAQAWGNLTSACSRCHAELRWVSDQRAAAC